MKGKLILICLIVISFSMYSQRYLDTKTGKFSDAPLSARPTRTLTPTSCGYIVSYCFESVALFPDELFEGCELWQISGFVNNVTTGEPAYPYSSDSFVIPDGYDAKIEKRAEEYVNVSSIPSPSRPPVLMSDTVGICSHTEWTIRAEENDWFPYNSIQDNGKRLYKDLEILNVGISPVQYNLSTGEGRICKRLEYEVIFVPKIGNNSLCKARNKGNITYNDAYLSQTTLNWQFEKNNFFESYTKEIAIHENEPQGIVSSGMKSQSPKYLMIAPTSLKSAVDMFAKWKKTIGFDVITAYKNRWGSEDIEDEISKYGNLAYLLLIGDDNLIPGKRTSVFPDGRTIVVVNDYEYACCANIDYDDTNHALDQRLIIPQVAYGRIPVSNLSDASIVLNRIIEYEKNPPSVDSFYDNYMFISKFLTNEINRQKANNRNSQTAYEISEYLTSKGKEITRMFEADLNQNPLLWKDAGHDISGNIVNPLPVPSDLQKPYYSWIVNPEDIIAKFNEGVSHVFYFAHGESSYWDSPRITNRDIKKLENSDKLPVVYSMACFTGDFSDENCFAKSLITSPKGGAIAMFGFTNATYTVYTDLIAYSLFNGLYPDPGMSPRINDEYDQVYLTPNFETENLIELGALHKRVLTDISDRMPDNRDTYDYKLFEASIFTLFGDPSMNIYLSNPSYVKPKLTETAGVFSISINGQPGMITLYDVTKDLTVNYNDKLSFKLENANEYILSVHCPGKIPFIREFNGKSSKVVGSASANNTVRDDLIWSYHSMHTTIPGQGESTVNLRFYGTTEIDGMEYHNCYVWLADKEFSEENIALIAYLREENGKVYVRYIPEAMDNATEKNIGLLLDTPVAIPRMHDLEVLYNEDSLIFDNSMSVGDVLRTTDNIYSAVVFNIIGERQINCLGKEYSQHLYDGGLVGGYAFGEVIGSRYGFIPFPDAGSNILSVDYWHLDKIYDLDGNLLYDESYATFEDLDVRQIDEDDLLDVRFYSCNGVEIEKPHGKGIYIKVKFLKSGEKLTEKIIVRK